MCLWHKGADHLDSFLVPIDLLCYVVAQWAVVAFRIFCGLWRLRDLMVWWDLLCWRILYSANIYMLSSWLSLHKRPGAWGLASWGCLEPIPHALETEAPVNLLFTGSRSSFLFISCQMQQQNNPREPPQRPFSNLGQGIKGSERHGMMASLHNHSDPSWQISGVHHTCIIILS